MPLKQQITSLTSFLKAKINLLALAFCGFFSGFFMLATAKAYYYYYYGGGWDLAYNAQVLWNILHGNLISSTFNAFFFVDHCFFLSFLIAPLYWIWPDSMLLLNLKITAFFVGAYVFFLILKKYLNPWIALGAMVAFSLAPANIAMLCDSFNYESFSIPLFLFIFKAIDDNNFKSYIIFCILLLLVKEQMSLLVMMFGVLSFIVKKEGGVKWALIPFLTGFFVFIFEIFILTPYLRRGFPVTADHYWVRYMQFGKTPQDILFFLLSHPSHVLHQFVLPQNIKWYSDLFSVWGCLSFFSPHILLVALPIFLKSILSNRPLEHHVTALFYAATFTPFIYLAAWNTLNQIQDKWRLPIHGLALAIMFIHAIIFIPQKIYLLHPTITNDALAKQRLIDEIPPNASVLTSNSTHTQLANRKYLYPIYIYFTGKYLISEKKFDLPSDTGYLLLRLDGEWVLDAAPRRYIPKMTALNFDDRWRLLESIEDMALYINNPSRKKSDRLIERSFEPFPVKNTSPQTFDDTISLESIEFPKVFPQKYRIFPVTMYWKCIKKTRTQYQLNIKILSSDGRSYYSKYRSIGSIIYPTDFWRRGEYVKETYFYLLPHMPRGNYIIQTFVYNSVSKSWVGDNEKNFSVS